MKTRWSLCAVLSILIGLLAFAARAQERVKIGPDGVEVDNGDVKVKADGTGVEVETPGANVKAKARGVEIDSSSDEGTAHDSGGKIGGPVPAGLKRQAAIVCRGNKSRVYSHVYITGNKDGVLIQGNCTITLKDSRIEVGRHGVSVQGNGDVRLVRTYVKGKKSAITIMGNGDVSASGCTLVGGIKKLGNGDFENLGKNVIRKR
jgi:hypothetical protein